MMRLFYRGTGMLLAVWAMFLPAMAGEGMWPPLLIDSLKLAEMRQMGFLLGTGEVYNTTGSSLKDAVVIFGGGCTGEVISAEGLVITNHHCGFSRIQAHSTLEHNYLRDGFWASSKSGELPNPGLTVSFLVRMEDVTKSMLEGIDNIPDTERDRIIRSRSEEIAAKAVEGTLYQAEVESFFNGKAYYLCVYEVFRDIRLVGAPPESIGRFGGDTDNWIWPRHTGDFSLFRIYANKDNQPADYSADNVPYKPRRYLRISTDGVKEGDFTMVIGYPGRTDEYLTAEGLSIVAQKTLPAKIEMRTLRLDALQQEMDKGPAEKLRFSSKYVNISNSWKKWIGVTKGVKRTDAIARKMEEEQQFTSQASRLSANSPYQTLMADFNLAYSKFEPYYVAADLGNELMGSVDLFPIAGAWLGRYNVLKDSSRGYIDEMANKLRLSGLGIFRSGIAGVDRTVLPELLRIYAGSTSPAFHPSVYNEIREKYGNDYRSYTESLFRNSMFTDSVRYLNFLQSSPSRMAKKLAADPLPELYRQFSSLLRGTVRGPLDSMNHVINRLYRTYLTGKMELNPDKVFYPDANFTMRVTYGKVEGYKGADAVNYRWYSTLDGAIEKDNPEIADYRINETLLRVYKEKDFGRWTVDGKVPVCFIATNHTSGGNSGSPVLNATGELIGINFDRNWEGTVSDYTYNQAFCRNITLDVRYVLFIIEKVAKAGWLLDELTLTGKGI